MIIIIIKKKKKKKNNNNNNINNNSNNNTYYYHYYWYYNLSIAITLLLLYLDVRPLLLRYRDYGRNSTKPYLEYSYVLFVVVAGFYRMFSRNEGVAFMTVCLDDHEEDCMYFVDFSNRDRTSSDRGVWNTK